MTMVALGFIRYLLGRDEVKTCFMVLGIGNERGQYELMVFPFTWQLGRGEDMWALGPFRLTWLRW